MVARNKGRLSWLHLSDFHLRTSDRWSQDVVLKSLLADVSQRYSGDDRPDFIFITGDLAYSGQQAEYELIGSFLSELLAVTRVPNRQLFIVPGNHDVDRECEPDTFIGVRSVLHDVLAVDKFLGSESRRRTLFRRQHAFREFANRICERDVYTDSSFSHALQTTIGPISVSVLLIDSSWLSAGGKSDAQAIVVGERQLVDMGNQLPAGTLRVGLMHHPLSWLVPFEQSPIANLLGDSCHLLFRGHVHEDSYDTIGHIGRRANVFTAGASYETRLSHNCYGYGFVDLLDGGGLSIVHKYRNDSKSWTQQEPIVWNLIDAPNSDVPLTTIWPLLQNRSVPYLSYLACLVGHKLSEIPVAYGGTTIFLSCSDPLASRTALGQCLAKVRHIIQWRSCWYEKDWAREFDELLRSYAALVGKLSSEAAKAGLARRDIEARALVHALTSDEGNAFHGTSLQQVAALAEEGSFDLALSLLSRARQALTDAERLSACRLELKIHLATANHTAANESADLLISIGPVEATDHLLVATSRANASRFADATSHLFKARKQGISFADLQQLASLVAGQTGDADLIRKLSASHE